MAQVVKRAVLRWLLVCAQLTSAAIPVHAAEISDAQFTLDSGLKSADVGALERTLGSSHYRMRLYRFSVNEAQASLLSKRVQSSEPQDSPWLQGVASLVEVQEAYLPEQNTSFQWKDLLPPYSTEQMHCFTTQAPDFGFRYLRLTPSRGGKRTALLALGQQRAGQMPLPCAQTVGNGQSGSAYLAQYLFGGEALPYPSARRVLAEKLLLDYQPTHLDFHALIFVDSSFWFRFSASKTQFDALVRRFALRETEFAEDASRHTPDWFKPDGKLRTRCWMDIGGNAGQISAYWRDDQTIARVSGNLRRWQKPCPIN